MNHVGQMYQMSQTVVKRIVSKAKVSSKAKMSVPVVVIPVLGSYFTVSLDMETSGSIVGGGGIIAFGAAIANLEGTPCTKQNGTIEAFYSLVRPHLPGLYLVYIHRRKCAQTYRGASANGTRF